MYATLQPRQVKSIFLGLDDVTVMNYLRALEPRAAGRIIKEFKTPEETARIERILERIRQAGPTTTPSESPTASATP